MPRCRGPVRPARCASATFPATQVRRSTPRGAQDSLRSPPPGHQRPEPGTRAPTDARCSRAAGNAGRQYSPAPLESPCKSATRANALEQPSDQRPDSPAGLRAVVRKGLADGLGTARLLPRRNVQSLCVKLLVERPVVGGEPGQVAGVLDGVRVSALAPLEAGAGADVHVPACRPAPL